MGVTKIRFGYGSIAAVLVVLLILGGCGSRSLKYSNLTRTSFQEFRSYQWGKAEGLYRQDPMLEANVQSLADRDLEQKGWIKKTGKADLVIWMSYEYDQVSSSNKLRTLNLNISRADNNELVWRGTAVGAIRADANAGDLKKVVENILADLPSK